MELQAKELDPCAEDIADGINEDLSNAVVFGWQFRPVLGADYVKGGMRQVFAQLSLPVSVSEAFVPTVFVQTRWRAYDPKKQVVGMVYRNTCTVRQDTGGISLLNPIYVRNVTVTDVGNGIAKLRAKGSFSPRRRRCARPQ